MTQPQACILALSVDDRLERSVVVAYYKKQGYSKPEASASNVLRKLVEKKLLKKTRVTGIYKTCK